MLTFLKKIINLNHLTISTGIIVHLFSFPVLALEPGEIAQQAEKMTVKIIGSDVDQSGILLGQDDNNYWVLTCTPKEKSAFEQAKIITYDHQSYNPLKNKVIQLEQFPITLIPISIERSYETANLGNSNNIKPGETVYIAGFMQSDQNEGKKLARFLFTDGIISSLVEQSNQLSFTYTNQIYREMEGNPIFNAQGALIGIHCQNYPLANRKKKDLQFNWGIPINPLTEYAQQKGLNFDGFSALGSPPPSSDF